MLTAGGFGVGGIGGSFTDVFKNPFGGGMDGTRSAAMMNDVGGFLLGMVGRAPNQVD